MWHTVCTLLSEHFQYAYVSSEKTALRGGEVSESYFISNGHDPVFVKVNDLSFLPQFQAEYDALSLLSSTETVRVPTPYAVGTFRNKSFLLMEYIDLTPLNTIDAAELGAQLACLHLWGEQLKFGFDEDNGLASTPQPNGWQLRWDTFFAEQRIGWQLQLCQEKGIYFGDIKQIVGAVREILSGHTIEPSLLLGNLLSPHCGSSSTGPVVFNPACYWGDRECDIAASELANTLFTPLPATFQQAYERLSPLPAGYSQRKSIYQLYHLLNLCNLFGGDYLAQAQTVIDRMVFRS